MSTVTRESQIIEHWGVISDGVFIVEYQTRQPDPSHWIAVGVVTMPADSAFDRAFPRMLVGSGRTEDAAIHDLEQRLVHEARVIPAEP